MARGWESKSVESQQADRDAKATATPAISADEAALAARRRTIELTRTRALADLATARSPAHRQMLEAAIRALDDQITALDRRG